MSKTTNLEVIPFERKVRELNYHLLPGKLQKGSTHLALYNRVFFYWQKFWADVFHKNGTPNKVQPSEFLRMDYIGVVLHGDRDIVGFYLHTLLNLDQGNIEHHPYLAGKEADLFLKYTKESGDKLAMTIEYITLDENWRKCKIGKSLNKVLLGTALELQRYAGADLSFIKAREDVKVSNMISEHGGISLKSNIDMHNTPVSFMVLPSSNIATQEDIELRNLSQKLWQNRIDWTNQNTSLRKIA